MDPQKAIYELTTHLLGDDWCIIDSVSDDQANESSSSKKLKADMQVHQNRLLISGEGQE